MLRFFKKIIHHTSKKKKIDLFEKLPNEIIINIFQNLSPKQLAETSLVCKRFNGLAKHSSLSLKNIQSAFFAREKITLNERFKQNFNVLMDYILGQNISIGNVLGGTIFNFEKNLKQYFNALKTLVTAGAEINSSHYINQVVYGYWQLL